jgi:Ca2+-binding RTX toxin-like protein
VSTKHSPGGQPALPDGAVTTPPIIGDIAIPDDSNPGSPGGSGNPGGSGGDHSGGNQGGSSSPGGSGADNNAGHNASGDGDNGKNGTGGGDGDHSDGVMPNFSITDMTTGASSVVAGEDYLGPVPALQRECVMLTQDNINITSNIPNVFLHSGSGEDALSVLSGINVLDGSTGSNFLTGGSGTDTFFVDDRGPVADIWSTVVGFHGGDAATVWGVTPQDFDFSWVDNQGAVGFAGLTLHATAAGKPIASLTLAGFTTNDLNDGRLSISFGHTAELPGLAGSNYMMIHAN